MKNWKTIAIALAVIVIVVVIYYFATANKITIIKPKPLPTGGSDDYENEQVRANSLALFEDMNGFNYSGHDMAPFETLLTSSDNFITLVYNDFNDLYGSENKGTLTKWINDETFIYSSEVSTIDSLMTRFQNLNLA